MLASLEKTFELQKRHAGSSYGQYEKGRDRAGAVAQLVEDLSNMMKPWVPDIAPHTTGHCGTHVILEPSEGGGRRIESSRLSSGYIMNLAFDIGDFIKKHNYINKTDAKCRNAICRSCYPGGRGRRIT